MKCFLNSYLLSLIIFCMVLLIICHKVLDVVRANYDSLTLKLQDSLDQYERYSEKPRENAFFTNLVSQNLFILKLRIFKSIVLCYFPDRIVQQNDLVTLYNNRCWIPNLEIVYFFFSVNLHLLIIVKTLRVGIGGANYDLLNVKCACNMVHYCLTEHVLVMILLTWYR